MFYFQLFNDHIVKYNIHYEIVFENYESKGFILSTNLKLTIDFEKRTAEKSINNNFIEIRNKLLEWHINNYKLLLMDLEKCLIDLLPFK